MTGWLAFAWLLSLSVSLAWVSGVLASAAWVPFLSSASMRPTVRRRRGLMAAALPWLLMVIVSVSVVLLAIAKPLGLIADHCLYHDSGHPHFCLEHIAAITPSATLLGTAALLFAAIVLVLARHISNQRQLGNSLRSMIALSRGRGLLKIVDDARPLAFSAAAPQPSILMTTGLLTDLDPRQRRIVLAHEVAHLRHRDLFWCRVFEFMLVIHLPWMANWLRQSWRQAIEERADDVVADRFGRDHVADTLLALIRLKREPTMSALSARGGNTIRRIDRMLGPVAACKQTPALELIYATAAVLLPVLILSNHHALETVLGFLLNQ